MPEPQTDNPPAPAAAPPAAPRIVEIKCPACQSVISSDGKEVKEKSDLVAKVEKQTKKIEELKAEVAELEKKARDSSARPAPVPPNTPPAPAPAPAPARGRRSFVFKND